jgi:hypothetical protein
MVWRGRDLEGDGLERERLEREGEKEVGYALFFKPNLRNM